MEQAVKSLGALARESRLAIYRLLVQAGTDGLRAGRIADALELPNATLSFHLAQLRQSGLVAARRAGRQIIYSADYGTMNDLLEFLTDNCCGGGAETCLPATPARRTRNRRRRKAS